jgi:hypothetical protein
MATEKRTGLTVSQLDLEKRYDIYHCVPHEERLYENVKVVGLRSFDARSLYSGGFGDFLEIESAFGSRFLIKTFGIHLLIKTFGIHLMCEHGTMPIFKVFRSWLSGSDS